jgi:hypothetical protein
MGYSMTWRVNTEIYKYPIDIGIDARRTIVSSPKRPLCFLDSVRTLQRALTLVLEFEALLVSIGSSQAEQKISVLCLHKAGY